MQEGMNQKLVLDVDITRECALLIAEDDPDDRLILETAFRIAGVSDPLTFVADGEELMRYLKRNEHSGSKLPYMLLVLDLNMPKKDGRSALREIREDPLLRHLPVVVLTTSSAEQDIEYCRNLGVSNYVTKPSDFDGFIQFAKYIKTLCQEDESAAY
jgi:CheY-like chemotaxis protein